MSDDDGEMLLKDWTVVKSLQKMERRRNLETTIVGLVCVPADGLVRGSQNVIYIVPFYSIIYNKRG